MATRMDPIRSASTGPGGTAKLPRVVAAGLDSSWASLPWGSSCCADTVCIEEQCEPPDRREGGAPPSGRSLGRVRGRAGVFPRLAGQEDAQDREQVEAHARDHRVVVAAEEIVDHPGEQCAARVADGQDQRKRSHDDAEGGQPEEVAHR